jgi:hypothetical protein
MGFEFKIIANLSEGDKQEIGELINKLPILRLENYSDVVELHSDGFYVCKYHSSNLWDGLEDLKKYLLDNSIKFRVVEL